MRHPPGFDAPTDHGAENLDEVFHQLAQALGQILTVGSTEPEAGRSIFQEALLAITARRREIEKPGEGLIGMDRLRRLKYWHERQQGVCEAVDQLLFQHLAQEPRSPLGRMIDQLPPRCRSLLRLRYGLDVATGPIAMKLSDRKAGIRKTTSRCLTAFARILLIRGLAEKSQRFRSSL